MSKTEQFWEKLIMSFKRTSLIVLGIVIIGIICIHTRPHWAEYFSPHADEPIAQNVVPETYETYPLKHIEVIKGDMFDLVLLTSKGESRILGKLPVQTTKNSKDAVLELLNKCQEPRVLVRDKQKDSSWDVDVLLKLDDKEITLSQWLKDNHLVFE